MHVQNMMLIHTIVVYIFQSELQLWANWHTEEAPPAAT